MRARRQAHTPDIIEHYARRTSLTLDDVNGNGTWSLTAALRSSMWNYNDDKCTMKKKVIIYLSRFVSYCFLESMLPLLNMSQGHSLNYSLDLKHLIWSVLTYRGKWFLKMSLLWVETSLFIYQKKTFWRPEKVFFCKLIPLSLMTITCAMLIGTIRPKI